MAKKTAKKKKTTKKAKKATKKSITKKKAVPKKKTVARKKKTTKKKTATKKKVAVKKKVSKKKTAAKKKKAVKKTVSKKKKAAKKKVTEKKSAPKKKTATKKKAAPKKKVAARKKAVTKKKRSTKAKAVKKVAPAKADYAAREKPGKPALKPTESRISLMVVDPYRLFVFWDINESDIDRLVNNGEGYSMVLRVFFYEGNERTGYFDVQTTKLSDQKYLDVIPDRGYLIEFGVTKGVRYFPLVSSRTKYTPSFKIASDDLSAKEYELMIKQVPSPDDRISS